MLTHHFILGEVQNTGRDVICESFWVAYCLHGPIEIRSEYQLSENIILKPKENPNSVTGTLEIIFEPTSGLQEFAALTNEPRRYSQAVG